MADNPITTSLPADLPEQWTYGQTVGPNGTDVGLTQQHGYNYLMQQVNAAQQAATQIGAAFSGLYGSEDIIPISNGGTGAQNAQTALSNLGAVPNTRKINGKALSADITLDAEDVGAGPALFEDTTYYVNATSGNDTTGDGSQSAPYATLQKALSVVPKNLNGHTATIRLAAGTYDITGLEYTGAHGGTLRIMASTASGAVCTITGGGRADFKYIYALLFYSITFQGANKTGDLYFYSCNVSLENCAFTNMRSAISCFQLSQARAASCTFNNCVTAVAASHGSVIGVYNATGSGNWNGYYVNCGGFIGITSSSMTSSDELYVNSGGVIVDGQTIAGAVQIETGSYVGTGLWGAGNKNTLTFNFQPQILFVQGLNSSPDVAIISPQLSQSIMITSSSGTTQSARSVYVSLSGTTISWYHTSSPDYQLNGSNQTYYYTAIG